MKNRPQRKSPRLPAYDYSQCGAYFVTICTHHWGHLFGALRDGAMQLNDWGRVAGEELEKLPARWESIAVEEFVVMPNHVHVVVVLSGAGEENLAPTNDAENRVVGAAFLPPAPTIATIIGNYKAGVTRRIRKADSDEPIRIWQSRYHDHIIRNEESFFNICEYVQQNPQRWEVDVFYG